MEQSWWTRDDDNTNHQDDTDDDSVDAALVLEEEHGEDHGEDRRREDNRTEVSEFKSHHCFIVTQHQERSNSSLETELETIFQIVWSKSIDLPQQHFRERQEQDDDVPENRKCTLLITNLQKGVD